MIVRPHVHWFRLLFVWHGSVLSTIASRLLWTTGFAAAVTLLHGRILNWKIPLNFAAFSLLGLTLAIFLGFRNNTSYARFWEARTLWGAVLNETRTLVRQALTLTDASADATAEVRVMTMRLIAFTHMLRHQLRSTDGGADLARLLSGTDSARLARVRYKASTLLLMVGEWIRDRRVEGRLAPSLVQAMELPLGRLTDALGGCERIAGTPIPFTYAVIIHRTIFCYCLLLPFGLVDALGTMTPLIVALVAYTFFALEALASEIEEPFGIAANDLALDAMSRTIEYTLREMLGERAPDDVAIPPSFIQT